MAARIRPNLTLAWCGPSLLIADQSGAIGSENLNGYYFRETRFLSRLAFEVSGRSPHLCTIENPSPREICIISIHPELQHFSGGGTGESGQQSTPIIDGVPARALQFRIRMMVRPASLVISTVVENRSNQPVEMRLSWHLAADFADLLEVMDGIAAPMAAGEHNGERLKFADHRLPFETHVHSSPGIWTWRNDRLETLVSLSPADPFETELRIKAVDRDEPIETSGEEARLRAWWDWESSVTRVFVPADAPMARATESSIRDVGSLALLEGKPDEWLTPAAGMPLYPALFARDALTASWQSLLFDRGALLDASLTRVGRLQGKEDNAERDEQPGRIIQQARRGPLARLGENPFARYYGDFASPFDFVMYLGQLFAWTGDREQLDRHWDTAARIMDWARTYADPDGDGFLEYCTRSPAGPLHQGWKDSGRAIVNALGIEVKPPLAVAEVQGYYFAALQTIAMLSLARGELTSARDLWTKAEQLRAAFNASFWLDDEGFPALALDSHKQQVRSIASNAGQCLATGIIADEHVPRVVRRLFEADMFSGWGIRTLSSLHPAYDPLSYHLGSVWPVENGTIVFGLRRYGFEDRALELATALYDLAMKFDGFRVPECVGGYAREAFSNPGAYPQANAPQAWNQSVPGIVLQSLLGIFPVASARTLLIDPVLPFWLPELELRGLRVGQATITIRFERTESGKTDYEVLEKHGDLCIIHQPPINDLGAGWLSRLGGLITSLSNSW